MAMVQPESAASGNSAKSRTVRKGGLLRDLRRDKYLYVLALPGVLFFLIFKFVPMWGVVISFQNFSPFAGITGSEWVGFEHFQRFFTNPDFMLLFRNTMAINLMNLVLFFPLPIVLSLLLNELRSVLYQRVIQSIVYMPHFLSWVIISGLTFLLFAKGEGLVNKVLEGLGFARMDFLTNPNTFWAMLTVQSIWKECGWGTILFLAAMASIDPGVYEAAKIDGAGRFRQMWHITLPAIRTVIITLLILRLGHMLDVGFEQVFLMYNGAVSQVAEVFDTYVYRVGIQQGEFSYSTAAGLFKSIVGLVLVVIANWISKKMGEEGVY
ncbi:ABC transporter permease [Paenibacillus oryzisoli]|uniref:Polysaccharide ABC transporter ATP-binding protein n=1 Tax=Paenibacillus oryzisoli TaxID=1850517 RepID=A0A198AJ05_9BACL|nr:sugar ABC transporter permease [Paenibacillus oryzisoli]OAS21207.1 polysaccharide ABC transporter ATP-binding protein [Paenibacillus oryzisoli]